MVDRIKAAVDARTDPAFVIMARTDALAVEGLQAAIDRACACVEAGADMIFPEAMTELAMYQQFADAVKVPILANITEFGATPLFTRRRTARGRRRHRALSAVRVPRDEQGGARTSTRRCAATARRRASSTRCRRARSSTTTSATTRTSRSSTRCSRRRDRHERCTETTMTDAPAGPEAEEIGRAVRRHRRQHRAVHGRPHRQRPALPRLRHPRHRRRAASSRRSPTCWSTASCPTSPSSPATRRSCKSLRGLPAPVKDGPRAHPGGRASDGRDAHRRARRSARVLPEKDDHNVAGARDIADRLMASLRLDAAVLVPLRATTAGGSRSRPTTIRSAATSCTCCTASSRRALWVRAMHTSLILYAEHEFNASTFAARVIAGTGSDMYSAITGAHRRAARAEARRRQRVRLRRSRSATTRPTRPRPTSRRRVDEQGDHHRLRPPGLHDRRPAQQGDQGGRAHACRRTPAT